MPQLQTMFSVSHSLKRNMELVKISTLLLELQLELALEVEL